MPIGLKAGIGTIIVALIIVAANTLWPQPPAAGCLILNDAQGSAAIMKSSYQQWLPGQAEGCALSTRADLSIGLIAGETTTGTVIPVTASLSKLAYTGNGPKDDTIAKTEIADAIAKANTTILAAPAQQGGTDILGSICVAHDTLARHSPTTLIINSDGINNRAPYLLSTIPLDDSSISTYVDQMKSSGQLCDLTGTRVQMYGVGIGEGTSKLSADRLAGVRRFWESVFQASGADLVTYQRNP